MNCSAACRQSSGQTEISDPVRRRTEELQLPLLPFISSSLLKPPPLSWRPHRPVSTAESLKLLTGNKLIVMIGLRDLFVKL